MCPLASGRPTRSPSPATSMFGRAGINYSSTSNTSSIPMANYSAGRKTILNSSQELEIPRKKTFTQPVPTRSETPTRRGKWDGPKANDESKPPPPRYMRKRPTSASYESRNVVINPPEDHLYNRRKVITPTRERPNRSSIGEDGSTPAAGLSGSLHESVSVKSLLSYEDKTSNDHSDKRGRRASPMALRSSFEGGSFANVKVS